MNTISSKLGSACGSYTLISCMLSLEPTLCLEEPYILREIAVSSNITFSFFEGENDCYNGKYLRLGNENSSQKKKKNSGINIK